MRLIMFAMLAGCVDTNSEPTTDLGELVEVHVSCPTPYNSLEVTVPPSTKILDHVMAAAGTYIGADYSYAHREARIGDGPRALAFTALLDDVAVATGELTNITYTLNDDGQNRESDANLAITLTVTP